MGWNIGTGRHLGRRRTGRSTTTATPPDPHYDRRRLESLVRHPDGVVAACTRKPRSRRDQHREDVVGRLNGATWDLKVFQATAGALSTPRLAVNAAGEIVVAADDFQDNVDEIYASIAPSLTAAWPALTLRLALGDAATEHYRDPFVVGGGPAFAVGWGVHWREPPSARR